MSGGPHRARRAVLLASALVLAACAPSEPPSGSATSLDPPATAAGGGSTPGTTAPPTDELVQGLLRLDDVRPLPAFGLDTREQPVLDPQQFSLATLRGPCGAAVETPFDESGAFRVFRSTISLIVEAIAAPGEEAADAFVTALREDEQPGCPPFTEQLGSAEPSTITFEAMLDLAASGDGAVGWTQEVADSTGRVGYRAILVAAEGDRLWLLAVLSPNPIPPEHLVELGELATARATGT